MRPRVGCRNLVSKLKQVVLPAPFGPMSAWMVPRSTRRLTPLTATNPANSLVKSSVSRMYSLIRAGPFVPRHLEGLHQGRPDPQRSHSTNKDGHGPKIEPARMANHPGGPMRPTRGEGGGRARRSQLSKSQVLVDPADLHGADIEAIGVVLALPAAAAIAVHVIGAAVSRAVGDRSADDDTAENARADAPAVAGLG